MTQQERKELREQIVAYRKEGHLIRECCEHFGVTKGYVKHACLGIDYPWVRDTEAMRQAALNQHREAREETAIRMIARKAQGFEYVSGYTSHTGNVTIRCKTCGSEFVRTFWSVKHGHVTCDECKRQNIEQKKERKREFKQMERRLTKPSTRQTKQDEFKVCPVCNGMFFGSGRYCSKRCSHKNKWTMRDGYRYMFPLEEVYDRDNGVCYLCGGLCDWNDYELKDGVIVYGNNYPSRDHVIPKACGGENSWENIRLAHRVCNSRKYTAPYAKF
jgi:hypothetical protein